MIDTFFTGWQQAAITSIGFFWMAFWAFGLGYLISSLIQVLVTRERMQQAMGKDGPRSMALASFFGFISSSCSFAALSATRALFKKGAGLAPSLAFLLASTNLVIELGIVIAIFLGWQFIVGEYIGGILLILCVWVLVRLTKPKSIVKQARERLQSHEDEEEGTKGNWKEKLKTWSGWEKIARTYVMEWQMVWKDVTIGFTVAGIISAFVPNTWFEFLFVGSESTLVGSTPFVELLIQTLVGPVAAFFTFIGSMGNIPLAAILFDHGVSFAGVMAFIFSDLVVLPVLRINANYYGWKMALYILSLLLVSLVVVSLSLHYGLAAFDLLPKGTGQLTKQRELFQLNYGLVLNLIFIIATAFFVWLGRRGNQHQHAHHHGSTKPSLASRILQMVVIVAIVWLAGGLLLNLIL